MCHFSTKRSTSYQSRSGIGGDFPPTTLRRLDETLLETIMEHSHRKSRSDESAKLWDCQVFDDQRMIITTTYSFVGFGLGQLKQILYHGRLVEDRFMNPEERVVNLFHR
jgi:hypothetical protein